MAPMPEVVSESLEDVTQEILFGDLMWGSQPQPQR